MDIHSLKQPVGFNIVHLDSVSSTNTIARELLQKEEAGEGLVIVAEHQTEGRGQQNSVWESHTGKNLLCSFVLTPTFMQVQQQVYLNMAMCLAVSDTLNSFTRGVKVKWPNDVYIHDKKVAGLLIENALSGEQIRYSIVGIGININQQGFDEGKATSLSMNTGLEHAKEEVLQELINNMGRRYAQLQLKQFEKIRTDYHNQLMGWKQLRTFKANEEVFDAVINGVDEDGRLVLQRMNRVEKYMVKQISML